jgi:hypothetical protein
LLTTFAFVHEYRPKLALLALSNRLKTTSAVIHIMTPKVPATIRYTSLERKGRRNERLNESERIATEARKLPAAMAKRMMVGARFVCAGHTMGSSPLRSSMYRFPR